MYPLYRHSCCSGNPHAYVRPGDSCTRCGRQPSFAIWACPDCKVPTAFEAATGLHWKGPHRSATDSALAPLRSRCPRCEGAGVTSLYGSGRRCGQCDGAGGIWIGDEAALRAALGRVGKQYPTASLGSPTARIDAFPVDITVEDPKTEPKLLPYPARWMPEQSDLDGGLDDYLAWDIVAGFIEEKRDRHCVESCEDGAPGMSGNAWVYEYEGAFYKHDLTGEWCGPYRTLDDATEGFDYGIDVLFEIDRAVSCRGTIVLRTWFEDRQAGPMIVEFRCHYFTRDRHGNWAGPYTTLDDAIHGDIVRHTARYSEIACAELDRDALIDRLDYEAVAGRSLTVNGEWVEVPEFDDDDREWEYDL